MLLSARIFFLFSMRWFKQVIEIEVFLFTNGFESKFYFVILMENTERHVICQIDNLLINKCCDLPTLRWVLSLDTGSNTTICKPQKVCPGFHWQNYETIIISKQTIRYGICFFSKDNYCIWNKACRVASNKHTSMKRMKGTPRLRTTICEAPKVLYYIILNLNHSM